MKFLIISDIHIHNYKKFDINGSRLNNTLKAIIDVYTYAHMNGITHILFAGDLYDQPKAVPTEVITKTMLLFDELNRDYPDISWIAISGNHDQSSKNTGGDNSIITSLTLLDKFISNFYLIDKNNYHIDENIIIHGIPYFSHSNHFYEYLNSIELNKDYLNILLIHQTPQHSNPMIPFDCNPNDFNLFDMIFCGHIHGYEKLRPNFYIVGSPLHRDLGDEGLDKGYLIYDTISSEVTRHYLNYPKFTRTNEETNDYAIPVVEIETTVDTKNTLSINSTIADNLKKYTDIVGQDFELGKSFI